MKLEKYIKNPILIPNLLNDWESLAVCNPGVWYENGVFYMLYRCAGFDDEHIIRFGLAESEDGFNFKRMSNSPAFAPSIDGPDSGGVEDPRIVKFGKYFYITYAYRPHYPGKYWTFPHDVILLPDSDLFTPSVYRKNIANTGLLMTKDFKKWKRLGRLTKPNYDDRDVILFPEKINGKFALLHRPKEWIGSKYGCKYPSIWITFSEDMMVWEEESYLLLTGIENTWEEKIGGSTPPLKTDRGWLVIYHGVENGGKGYYRAGVCLLDLKNPTKVIARLKNFILEPEFDYETKGLYNGCVFPTGNVIVNKKLFVYYGAADQNIGVATCNIDDILDELDKNRI